MELWAWISPTRYLWFKICDSLEWVIIIWATAAALCFVLHFLLEDKSEEDKQKEVD